jgi:hypothetical protein
MDYKHKFIIKLFFDYLKKLIKMGNTSSFSFLGRMDDLYYDGFMV